MISFRHTEKQDIFYNQQELRAVAAKRTDQMNSPIMRFLQIEEQLKNTFDHTRLHQTQTPQIS